MELNNECFELRQHVQRATAVAGTNITVTNQQTESRNHISIKHEQDMDENSCIFEEALLNYEFPTLSKKEINSLKDPLSITEMQKDTQLLDIVKHEIVVAIKIEKDEAENLEVNNAPTNKLAIEKPYSCTVCNKSFNQKQHLIPHMRTHTGEKPYSCAACHKSFKQKQHLTRHMRTHTEEKPFSCTVCGSSFKQKSTLTIHMRTHTEEKPFPCTVCDISFRTRYNLAYHMLKHAREKPNSCTICNYPCRQMHS